MEEDPERTGHSLEMRAEPSANYLFRFPVQNYGEGVLVFMHVCQPTL